MLQLTNEVKRNGILVKENSELKQTLQVQQAIVQNLGQGLDEKVESTLRKYELLNCFRLPLLSIKNAFQLSKSLHQS